MITPKDWIDHGVPHSERRERFCGHFVETGGDGMRAFRLAFVVDPQRATTQLWRDVNKLMEDPAIKARIKEMRDSAARASMICIEQILQDWKDIAIADPNDIVSVRRTCCRFCWGMNHRFQWATIEEWQAAYARAQADKQPMPDASGGFGYDATRAPRETCPSCYGEGNAAVHVTDTRLLTGPARKLYKGAKVNARGMIEIQMHDQQQARELLARAMGFMGKEAAPVPAEPSVEPQKAVSAEQAREAYMRMIKR